MGKETGIAWTEHTFNPWWGCTKVSPGCDNCYAETFDARFGDPHWGKGVPRKIFGDKHWNEPLTWNKAAERASKNALVFCASMADVMDDEAPEGQRERLWELIDKTPFLTWQLLTKRPQRYERYLPETFKHWNVWLGTSAEDQANYDLRWPILAKQRTRFAGLVPVFISYEPALGPLTLCKHSHLLDVGVPDWLICGGESGDNRRPMEEKWATDIQRECMAVGTKFFMKQMSARTPSDGAKLIPASLLVREFPL